MITKKRLRRLAAGAAVAFMAAGLTGIAGHAEPLPGDINPDAEGALTVHKYDGAKGSDGGDGTPIDDTSGFGNALREVEFTLIQIDVDLLTSEGWQEVEGYYSNPGSAPTVSGTEKTATTNASGEAFFTGLPVGAYLVTETNSGPNLITEPAAPFIVTIPLPHDDGWLYNVHVYPKNVVGDTPEPTKTVGDPDNEVLPGSLVEWTITAEVPPSALGYDEFILEDVLSSGLEFVEWAEISLGSHVFVEDDDYTVSADGSTVTFTKDGRAELSKGGTLSATLVTKVLRAGIHANKATITVDGNEIPTGQPTTNWATLKVVKFNEDNRDDLLEGAEFNVVDSTTGDVIGTLTTDGNGTDSITIWVGNNEDVTRDVKLVETKAPNGYVLPANPTVWEGTLTAGEDAEASIKIAEVPNHKPEGPELPLTGAQGALWMTIIGLGLIGLGSAAVGIRRSRSKS
ncbi:MAG TPA: SpaH/EbpB family LPXTG-anchored major pilin [Beutenbergiaceae bacterium]|nr:SpaH/EbpB family LPXTG-anchored major pilin [Beutenbergiaceae bacterium]